MGEQTKMKVSFVRAGTTGKESTFSFGRRATTNQTKKKALRGCGLVRDAVRKQRNWGLT